MPSIKKKTNILIMLCNKVPRSKGSSHCWTCAKEEFTHPLHITGSEAQYENQENVSVDFISFVQVEKVVASGFISILRFRI